MGGLSVVHWTVVAIAVILLFGGGRIARTMGEVGQGMKALRKSLSDDEADERLPGPAD